VSDTTANMRLKIGEAKDLQSVVRTMKAVAAASIGQYRKAELALDDYYHTVELGLGACFRAEDPVVLSLKSKSHRAPRVIGAVVFGSDQGLVGRFNEVVSDFAVKALSARPGQHHVWAVGERVQGLLTDAGLPPQGVFGVPTSVNAVAPLVGEILVQTEQALRPHEVSELHLFYNSSTSGAVYAPVGQRLLPLDESWRHDLAGRRWPTKTHPEVMGTGVATLRALISGYLFVSLFRACTESLTSENASRLAAMQRADKNIGDILKKLDMTFHRLRQSAIDEELFDVIAAFEALGGGRA
jgi:F-type H+-transporting ATPase subunit gamma